MMGGLLALVAYNFVDTFFVSQLDKGTGNSHYLAAMGFTFPVVMVIISISLGLGAGVSSVISRTIGKGDFVHVRRLTTHSLILAMLVVIVCAVAGLMTMDPIFRMLGAQPHMLGVIKEYMNIWYLGVVFIVIPMVGNNAIRAAGDMKIPGLIMSVGAVLNILLDPIMIFGWWGFPKMGITGAALATVISRAVGTVLSLWVLHHRKKMLDVSRKMFHHMLKSWGHIAYVAVPAAATTILFPVSLGVLTRLAADIGSPVVAAVSAGNRVLAFAMIPIWALGSTLGPFVGQNWGAKNFARGQTAANLSCGFCIVWGLLCTVVFAVTAEPLAWLFGEQEDVHKHFIRYMWIIPLGLGLRGISVLACSWFNAINKPFRSGAIDVLRLFVLTIPLAWLGKVLFESWGLFGGTALACIIAGIFSYLWVITTCRKQIASQTVPQEQMLQTPD